MLSTTVRSGTSQVLSEGVATFGLLSIIWGCARGRSSAVAFAVAAYITAAYWFTASTSFANPAVTLARAFTDVCRYSTDGRSAIRRSAARRCRCRHLALSLVDAADGSEEARVMRTPSRNSCVNSRNAGMHSTSDRV
jgi:hypothetical protein